MKNNRLPILTRLSTPNNASLCIYFLLFSMDLRKYCRYVVCICLTVSNFVQLILYSHAFGSWIHTKIYLSFPLITIFDFDFNVHTNTSINILLHLWLIFASGHLFLTEKKTPKDSFSQLHPRYCIIFDISRIVNVLVNKWWLANCRSCVFKKIPTSFRNHENLLYVA